jgi:hypothetical protein
MPQNSVIMDVDSDVQCSTSAFAGNAAETRPSYYVEGAIVPGGTPKCSSSTDTMRFSR